MPNNRRKGERQKGGSESDRLIVPMKAGNAAGGKETTDGRAEWETPAAHRSGETVGTKLLRIAAKARKEGKFIGGVGARHAICNSSAATQAGVRSVAH